ncbi:Hpt domain-containing protein [Phenylobacterium sp.]|jgi:HPt (histidine-containing phosphotransfer) domain-containing protein|uniref:Hpt domain-containing protein n=1 Tax=Phenylobacterium sp. TaxID=1871053 RepID=UPI002F940D26
MNDPLASLRTRFLDRTREDLAQLRAGAEPRPLVHRLAGTAGMLGFADLGRLAAVVDEQLVDGEANPADWAALLASMAEATRPS